MRVAAVVPTRNEVDTIGPLVKELDRFCDAVIVADDSTDGTYEVASAVGAMVIEAPSGLGPSYLKAWEYIPADWYVLHVDAGGSHRIDDCTDLIDLAALKAVQVMVGSRFLPGSTYEGSSWREWCSRRMTTALNITVWQDMTDWTSGLRLYSPKARKAIERHDFRTTGHAWQIEALWVAMNEGCMVDEAPISYIGSNSQLTWKRSWEAIKLLGWIWRQP